MFLFFFFPSFICVNKFVTRSVHGFIEMSVRIRNRILLETWICDVLNSFWLYICHHLQTDDAVDSKLLEEITCLGCMPQVHFPILFKIYTFAYPRSIVLRLEFHSTDSECLIKQLRKLYFIFNAYTVACCMAFDKDYWFAKIDAYSPWIASIQYQCSAECK